MENCHPINDTIKTLLGTIDNDATAPLIYLVLVHPHKSFTAISLLFCSGTRPILIKKRTLAQPDTAIIAALSAKEIRLLLSLILDDGGYLVALNNSRIQNPS